jgi:hypothetical protein
MLVEVPVSPGRPGAPDQAALGTPSRRSEPWPRWADPARSRKHFFEADAVSVVEAPQGADADHDVALAQQSPDFFAKQTLSRELRAMGYRKLSARPRHHAQAENAVEDFKKLPRAPGRNRT